MIHRARNTSIRTVGLLAGGLLLVGSTIWYWRRDHDQRTGVEVSDETTEPREREEPVKPEPEPTELASRARLPARQPELANDGIPIMGPGKGDSTANGPRHPHPITPQHERIFKENSILGSLNGAIDVGDADGLRQLNQKYKAEYPDDPQQLQSGYDLIADCLERRSDETRARAERYFNQNRGSTLRRYAKRHCLD